MACLARTSFFFWRVRRACSCCACRPRACREVWREEKRVERGSKIVVRIDVVVHGRQPSTQPNNIHGHTAPGHASPRVAQYRQNVKLAATLLYILRVQLGADLRGFLLAHGADALISVSHAPKGERGALAEGDEVLLTDEGGHDRTWFRSGSGVWGRGSCGDRVGVKLATIVPSPESCGFHRPAPHGVCSTPRRRNPTEATPVHTHGPVPSSRRTMAPPLPPPPSAAVAARMASPSPSYLDR